MAQLARILVTRLLPRSREAAWKALSDIASHVRWMEDAVALEFRSDRRSGIGTAMDVETRVGPFRTTDRMEVTGWVEGRSIEVVHTGLVTGRGTLSLTTKEDGTLITWDEELQFPWWLGGAITAWLARPVLRRIWRRNLANFEATLSSP